MNDKFCTNCGNPLENGQKFCIACGTAVEETVVSEIVETSQIQETQTSQPKKKKNLLIPALIVFFLAVIATGVFLIFFFPLKHDDGSKFAASSSSSKSSVVSSSSTKISASAKKVSSSSTKQTSSSSSSSVPLKSWSDLTLNQQISLFVQAINAKTNVSSDLTTDQFAMTGDIDNGEIFMDSSSNSIGKISYSGDNVTITENGSSSSDTLSNLIKTYFATTAEQNQTNAIAQNMVAPSNLTGKKATSSSSSTTATSGMDLKDIEHGDYTSISGLWQAENDSSVLAIDGSSIEYGGYTIGAQVGGMENENGNVRTFTLFVGTKASAVPWLFVPKGVVLTNIAGVTQDPTDTTKDRIINENAADNIAEGTGATAATIQQATFYKEN